MPPIITNVDQKLLRTTKFPPEFNQKVDTSKINVPVIKNWAAGEVSRVLGFEDDVVIGLLFDLLEGQKHPDIKALQIQLAGFLGDEAPTFCKELWNLCLSAQSSETGVPQRLLEAKKLELIQEKLEQEQAAEATRKRRDAEAARGREMDDLRFRERRGRGGYEGGRRGRGGSDYDRRPRRDLSRSPPPRRFRDEDDFRRPPPRDTYVPGNSSNYRKRPLSKSPRRHNGRDRPSSRSPSTTPDKKVRRDQSPDRRERRPRADSPPARKRSPSPRRQRKRSHTSPSRSPSPPARRREHRRDRSRSGSPRRRRHYDSDDDRAPPRRRRSRSRSSDAQGENRKHKNSSHKRRSPDVTRRRSRSRSPRRQRRRSKHSASSEDHHSN